MIRSDDTTIRKFNPGTLQSDQEIITQFVVRNRELGILLEALRGNIESPSCQHVLVVAPRGRGKTMLLARVAAEIRTNASLSGEILPVRFMEESQEIFNMADFWLETLFHLAREAAASHSELARQLRKTHVALTSRWREETLEEHARASVLEAADRLGRKLVLMVENLQSLTEDVDGDFGWKLRATLQSESQIMLLGSATSRFKGLDKVDQPFFELFRILGLRPLRNEECQRLWQVVSGDMVSGREIRPLEILTGGSPRLLIIVAGFARHRSLRQLMEELVSLIDDHTEYFRGHLEVLPKTERRVYLAVIDLWQPSKPSEIAARARMGTRTVSTMLGRLVNRGAVTVEGTGRKRLYTAAERLYCIYYKLRRERDEAAIVQNLIHFMAVFYSEAELAEISGSLSLEAAESTVIREGIEQALSEVSQVDTDFSRTAWPVIKRISDQATTIAKLMLEEEIDTAFSEQRFERVIEIVDRTMAAQSSALPHAMESQFVSALHKRAVAYQKSGEFQRAIAVYEEVVERFGDSETRIVQEQVARALIDKGRAQRKIGVINAEVAAYEEVVKRFGASNETRLQWWMARALIEKGRAQGKVGDIKGAIASYEEVMERFGGSEERILQWWMARALIKKGQANEKVGDIESANTAYVEVTKRFGSVDAIELQEEVAKALMLAGDARVGMEDIEGAIVAYEEVVERFGGSQEARLQWWIARALIDKGRTHGEVGDVEGAIAAYEEVVERFGASGEIELHETVAMALAFAGDARVEAGDIEGAIAAYEEVVERFGGSDDTRLHWWIAKALIDKGQAQGEVGDVEGTIATYGEVVERFGGSEILEIQRAIATTLTFAGDARVEAGDIEGAIAAYEEVVERFGGSDKASLQWWIASALIDKGRAQGEQGDVEGAIAAYEEVVERFGGIDDMELQETVAMALTFAGDARVEAGDIEGAIVAYEEVAERFGGSDKASLQWWIARALIEKGRGHREQGDVEGAIAAYEEVVERFGGSEEARLQWWIARALIEKGRGQGELGDIEGAIAAYEEVVERFGGSDETRLHWWIARALVGKGTLEFQMDRAEKALHTCDELERMLRTFSSDNEYLEFKWRAKCIRTKALLAQEKHHATVDAFRSAYEVFAPTDKMMMWEMLQLVPTMVAGGVRAHDLVEILSRDGEKSEALAPLVIALRQLTGDVVRAPAELLEVAADIRRRIEEG